MTHEPGMENLHHKDIVSTALARLQRHLRGEGRKEVLRELRAKVVNARKKE